MSETKKENIKLICITLGIIAIVTLISLFGCMYFQYKAYYSHFNREIEEIEYISNDELSEYFDEFIGLGEMSYSKDKLEELISSEDLENFLQTYKLGLYNGTIRVAIGVKNGEDVVKLLVTKDNVESSFNYKSNLSYSFESVVDDFNKQGININSGNSTNIKINYAIRAGYYYTLIYEGKVYVVNK